MRQKKGVLTKVVVFFGFQKLMEVLVPPKEAWMRQNVSDPKLNVCHMGNVVGWVLFCGGSVLDAVGG